MATTLASAGIPDREKDERSEPAQVYREAGVDHWVVEAPRGASIEGKMAFTGPQAQQRALTYAYEKFGGARFFPY
jgi:hypothetical protein